MEGIWLLPLPDRVWARVKLHDPVKKAHVIRKITLHCGTRLIVVGIMFYSNADFPPLPPYLVAIQAWHCNAYSKYLMFQIYVNIASRLSSDLSIKFDQPMAG